MIIFTVVTAGLKVTLGRYWMHCSTDHDSISVPNAELFLPKLKNSKTQVKTLIMRNERIWTDFDGALERLEMNSF